MRSNLRQSSRTKKRLTVRYGVDDLELTSHTKDISTGGLFLFCRHLVPVGTTLHLRVAWSTGLFYGEGLIVRHEKVHHELQRIEDQGMGVRFLTSAEVVELVVPRHLRSSGQLIVDCSSKAQAGRIVEEQLKHGLLYVPIGEPPPKLLQEVTFEIVLVFRRSQDRIIGQGQVIQLLEPDGTQRRDRSGAVVRLTDAEQILQKLVELLNA